MATSPLLKYQWLLTCQVGRHGRLSEQRHLNS